MKDRRCPDCGEDPSIGLVRETTAVPSKIGAREPVLRVKMAEVGAPLPQSRSVRKRKSNYLVVKLVVAWACLMGLLATAAHFLWKEKPRQTSGDLAAQMVRNSYADEDVALIDKATPKFRDAFAGFLMAGTPEEKNQYVLSPVETVSRMARFYQMNPISYMDPYSVRGSGAGVIHLNNGIRAIESRWESSEGLSFDAVFFEVRGEWRLDWEDYVRFCEEPLALFLAGTGPQTAEFRVLARQRQGDERTGGGKLQIVLHAPRFGHPGDYGASSPEILVDPGSEAGRIIRAAFAERKAGKRIFGSTLKNLDPDGMIRLRVKLHRSETPHGREIRIEKVLACHWLAVEDPGVKP